MLRGFELWRKMLYDACEKFAEMEGYILKVASWSDIEQVNIRFMNPYNGRWESFDLNYYSPADRNINSAVKYVMDICKNTLGDTDNIRYAKYDAQYITNYLERNGLIPKGCMDEIHHIDLNTMYPTGIINFDLARHTLPRIKNVIFNDPVTIVFWADGTKTVVKAQDEPFDPEKGLAMAIAKRALGNQGRYFEEIKRWLPEVKEEQASVPHCSECVYMCVAGKNMPCADCAGLYDGSPNRFEPKNMKPQN